jgi:hypothetical protein
MSRQHQCDRRVLWQRLTDSGLDGRSPDGGFTDRLRCGYHGNALQVASWRASWTGNDDILELILRADANVNAEGGYFGNALQAAAWGGKSHTMRLLLDSGAQPTAQGG